MLHGIYPEDVIINCVFLQSIAGLQGRALECLFAYSFLGGVHGCRRREKKPMISYMLSTSRLYKDSEANPPVLPLKSPFSACVSSGNRIKMHTHVPLHSTREERVQQEPASEIASSCVCRERRL